MAEAGELSRGEGHRLLQAGATTRPVPAVAAAAAGVGHANITPDAADGVVRSLPVAVEGPDGELLPSLALAAIARLDDAPFPLTLRPRGVQLGDRLVPTGRTGLLDINYTEGLVPDAGFGHYLSAARFLPSAGPPPPRLEGKIVLVGLADPTLGDQHLTPANKEGGVPGVFVHAAAVNTMLTNAYLTHTGQTENLGWIFVMALVAAALVLRTRIWLSGIGALAAAAAYVVWAFSRFPSGRVMDLVYPLLALALAWVAGLGVRLTIEARERRQMIALLTQYVPAPVARQLVSRGRGRDLPRGSVTFLFTDVVGSTRAWEAWPKAMSEAMRRHDALIEQAVEEGGGAMVRPRGEGDSRFGVFTRPGEGARAAVEAQRLLFDEEWPTPDPIRVRIALHVGEGELREGDYYGSAVNRCARIRSLCGPGQILVSESMADAVRDALPAGVELRDLGLKALKDIAEPEHIFELTVPDRSTSRRA